MIISVVSMRASEVLALETLAPPHLEITCIDTNMGAFFQNPALVSLISLDISMIGTNDDDLIALSESEHLPALRWLSLAGNPVTKIGVSAICKAIKEGRLDLAFFDLAGTKYDASPYSDGEDEETAYWRIPQAGIELREEFGLQRWMTLGRPLEKEFMERISGSMFYPDRFTIK